MYLPLILCLETDHVQKEHEMGKVLREIVWLTM